MIELTLHLDSAAGLGSDERLTAVFEALTVDDRAGGAACGMDADGVLGATYQAAGATIEDAIISGLHAWVDALKSAGVVGEATAPAHLEIERAVPDEQHDREPVLA